MIGLETNDRNTISNDRIAFPHFLLVRLCPNDAGDGLKAKKDLGMPCGGAARLWEVVRRLELPYFSSGKARLTKSGEYVDYYYMPPCGASYYFGDSVARAMQNRQLIRRGEILTSSTM